MSKTKLEIATQVLIALVAARPNTDTGELAIHASHAVDTLFNEFAEPYEPQQPTSPLEGWEEFVPEDFVWYPTELIEGQIISFMFISGCINSCTTGVIPNGINETGYKIQFFNGKVYRKKQ